jgi:hypothetical protein
MEMQKNRSLSICRFSFQPRTKQSYVAKEALWLNFYITNQRYSEKMQHAVDDFIQFYEFTFNAF